jgi:phosphatidate cytidylyltransferase
VPVRAEPASRRWADLRLRVASALVLAPLALACLWAGGWVWRGLVLLALLGMVDEWRRMRLPAGLAAAGAAWSVVAAVAFIWLRGDATVGRFNVLFVVMIVWASDIGAYAAGRLIGGRRLAPRISPGKTWSGAAGGLLAAALLGLATGRAAGAAAAAVLSVLAQLGDLAESAAKRRAGVKDSGALIPGHGGLLDRLDGLLAAGPAAALLALALGPGVALWQ